MDIKVRGRVRVMFNSADISTSMQRYREKHSPTDCVLNHAKDCIAHLGDKDPRHISHKIKLPDEAIINFRVGGRD